ncbi:MAG: GAF domain-containing sensor histidine kinase [Anaerolineae bacterium]|nr:GAF domain-containing sensor histidine kinase [Anaerolineae bacterium]MDW8100262.1 GAF domain-containing sensor histidine kinase [Anaerolineae bacterium]
MSDLFSKALANLEDPHFHSAFLARLSRIGQFEGAAAVWAEALPWLCQVLHAQAASLVYGGVHPLQLQEGEIPDTVRSVIAAWEQEVTRLWGWVPPAASPISTRPPLPSIESPMADVHLQAIPLWEDNTLIGGLTLIWRGDHWSAWRFSMDATWTGLALVEAVVHLATLSERLHSMQQRLTHLTLFYDIGQKLTSSLDLSVVLQETTALAASALAADASTLMLVDEKTQELVFEIPVGSAGGILRQQRIPITQGIAGWVATHGVPTFCNDVSKDPRFSSLVDAMTGYVTRSVACVPLQVKGRIIGVLEVLNKQQPEGFTQQDLEWLSTIASQAAIAIENARLYEGLRQEQERIIRVQEQERHTLAQELHDGPVATLGAVIMSLENVQRMLAQDPSRAGEELAYLTNAVRAAYRELRQRLFELRPVVLRTKGLLAALQSYASYLREISKLNMTLELPRTLPDLTPQAAEAVFVVIQEAINNVRKHAQAQHCWLRIRWTKAESKVQEMGGYLLVEIEDDGLGFDVNNVERASEEQGSLGLLGMRERAELLGARLTVLSPRPNGQKGSLVRLEVPLERLISSSDSASSGFASAPSESLSS